MVGASVSFLVFSSQGSRLPSSLASSSPGSVEVTAAGPGIYRPAMLLGALFLVLSWPVGAVTQAEADAALDVLIDFVAERPDPPVEPPPVDEPPVDECEPNCGPPPPVDAPDPLVSQVQCPDAPSWSTTTGTGATRLEHYSCQILPHPDLDPSNLGFLFDFGVTFEMLPSQNKRQLGLNLHGFQGGSTAQLNNGDSTKLAGGVTVRTQDASAKDVNWIEWHSSRLDADGEVTNKAGRRMAIVLDYVALRWGDRYDPDKGLHISGTSMGATGVWHQVMTLPERWRDEILIASSKLGHTLRGDLVQTLGDHQGSGPYSPVWEAADIMIHACHDVHLSYMVHLAVFGATDQIVPYNDRIVSVLDACQIAYVFGIGPGGHEGGASISSTEQYAPDPLERRHSLPFIAWSNASSNRPYQPGQPAHYNLGLTWSLSGIENSTTRVSIPIRYKHRPLISMDPTTTVQANVRNTALTGPVSWSYLGQSGTVEKNEERQTYEIPLVMDSSDTYAPLVLVK